MSLWPKPSVSSQQGTPCVAEQQRIGQSVNGSCHVAENKAGAEPVGGPVGQDDFPQFQTRPASYDSRRKPMRANSLGRSSLRTQLRRPTRALLDEVPDAISIMPDVVVLLPGHGKNDLFGPTRHLRRGRGPFTDSARRVFGRASILTSPFRGKKKDDENAADRIPGYVFKIPAIS